MTPEFKAIIDEDIRKCNEAIQSGIACYDLHAKLRSKYEKIIDGFSEKLFDLFYDTNGHNVRKNLQIMKEKLELFKAMEYENCYSHKSPVSSVTFNNTNRIETTFNVTFADARKTIENMSALKEPEIQDVLEKIEELEKIVASSDRKSQKWDKAKEIIRWIADKSVDVGVTLLPLVLKIGQ